MLEKAKTRLFSGMTYVGEMFYNGFYDASRAVWYGPSVSALRSFFRDGFMDRPAMDETSINYDMARSLYRNDNSAYAYGGGFVRPLIDLPVEYMGMPKVSLPQSSKAEKLLNECIDDFWSTQLQEVFRDVMRDSKVYVRVRQPSLLNPLFTEEDRQHCKIEVLTPESCELSFDPSDQDLIDKAKCTHFIKVDTRTDEEIVRGVSPREEEHEIIEIITAQWYNFYDKTINTPLPNWRTRNIYGFVPIWTAYNEYAADLGGGQSDIEPILPFIKAFHDVMTDMLAAHKYHSIPKAKFNLKDVNTFLKNNFPEVLDPDTGQVKPQSTINWNGREVYFFSEGEDAGFIQATSVLGDSKTLLEFIIDCIAIASETPKWALLKSDTPVPNTDASVEPFVKKVQRKRLQANEWLVMILKMAQKMNGLIPYTPRLVWPAVRLDDLISKGQAIQQLIMSFDVAASHMWMADETVVKILAQLFPEISSPDIEMKLAESNVVPELPAPSPASDTQAASAKSSSGSGGSKSTTKASAS